VEKHKKSDAILSKSVLPTHWFYTVLYVAALTISNCYYLYKNINSIARSTISCLRKELRLSSGQNFGNVSSLDSWWGQLLPILVEKQASLLWAFQEHLTASSFGLC